ncbi:MAG: aminopeptidase N [Desulfobacteraceae bacterium]
METHEKKYLKEYRPPEYTVDSIDLKFDLEEEQTLVTSFMKIRRNRQSADETTPLVLDGQDLDVRSVVAGDMVLLDHEYEVGKDYFKLNRVPEQFTLEVTTRLTPEKNTSLEGLYKSGGTFCTQCEAEGFRKITCFPDRPDVMTRFSCIITADREKYPVLLSNGNPVARGALDNNRHFVKWEDPFKKPSYLFALVAGNLVFVEENFTTMSRRTIVLRIYVEKENIDKCGHAMKSLKQAMKWDEERFGREYNLDLYQIVAVNDFNMGAMENKGLNIFNSRYVLARPETATDTDFMNIQAVIAHEYFHNWTGNRITLKNWFQLSLKEGLTVFRDQEFSSDMNSRGVKRIEDVKKLRAFQFPEDAGPMSHPVRPESYIEMNNFYTLTVYEKGAEIIRMMFQIMGKSLFRRGMDLYFETFDGCAVTTEDFVKTMETVSGIDLSQFSRWYETPGTPTVSMTRSYDAAAKQLIVDLCQTPGSSTGQNTPPMHIPVKTGLVDKTGRKKTTDSGEIFHLTEKKQRLVFDNVEPETLPSLFREFSAPVKFETDFSNSELAILMTQDTDAFNRWDAAQQLFLREIKTIVHGLENQNPCHLSDHVTEAFRSLLNSKLEERTLIARTLTLPSENEIGGSFDRIPIDSIHRARVFLKKSLAEALKDDFHAVVSQCSSSDASDLSPAAMADRSLKNLALSYIGALDQQETTETVYGRFISAKNMTDEIAALSILADINSSLTSRALDTFYNKWQHDPLVIDKWFAVQAGSVLPDTLEKVEQLSAHRDFSLKTPNRIRSLTGVFSANNPVNFHRADGRGYRFVAGHIAALDSRNPQIAARLASAFNHWKRLDDRRQSLIEKELEKILTIPALSKDTYEIVSRALGRKNPV